MKLALYIVLLSTLVPECVDIRPTVCRRRDYDGLLGTEQAGDAVVPRMLRDCLPLPRENFTWSILELTQSVYHFGYAFGNRYQLLANIHGSASESLRTPVSSTSVQLMPQLFNPLYIMSVIFTVTAILLLMMAAAVALLLTTWVVCSTAIAKVNPSHVPIVYGKIQRDKCSKDANAIYGQYLGMHNPWWFITL